MLVCILLHSKSGASLFLYGPGYLGDSDTDRRENLHDGRAVRGPERSYLLWHCRSTLTSVCNSFVALSVIHCL